jgi:hypothetical protein
MGRFDRGQRPPRLLGLGAIVCLAVTSVGILSTLSDCYGYVTEMEISEVKLIYNEQEEFRILLKFETPSIPESYRIDFASIVIPKSQDSTHVPLEVYELSRSWNAATVGWGSPWEDQGGDFSDACTARWTIHPGVGSHGHIIDVTEYVRSIVKGEDNHGLIITPVGDDDGGFCQSVAPVFCGLGSLKVRVLYRGKD